MKKYFVVNSQEDEDGCILYPSNAIIDKAKKNDPAGNSLDRKTNQKAAPGNTYYPYYDEKTPFPIGAKRRNER